MMAAIYAIPRVPAGTLSRERISARLSADAPLIVVRAPAGSGKTIAVADWVNRHSADAHGVWFTVGAATSGRVAFWQGVLQVMQDSALLSEATVLRASIADLDSSPNLRQLLLRGFAQLRRDLLLVIDDLHLASDPEVAHDLVALLAATPGLQVVAITRLRGALELNAIAVTLGIEIIETTQLMFTADETAQLVERVGVADEDNRLSTALHRAVGGWPLTIRGVLVLVQRQGVDAHGDSIQERLEVAGAEVLRGVWAMQVTQDRDSDFVVRCSVPDALTTELAMRLTGRADAEDLLDMAESVGVGLWSDSVDEPVFTFSGAVRAELRRELTYRFPEEVRGLTQVTARWHVEHEEHFAALRHAIAIADLDLAEEAVVSGHPGLLRPHRQDIIELLGGLSLPALRRSPLLTMLLALALNTSGVHQIKAKEIFELAVVAARTRGSNADPVRRTVLLTIESVALRVTGQLQLSLVAAERMAAHYDGLSFEQKDQLRHLAPTLLAQTGLSFFYSGRPRQAMELFQSAYELPDRARRAGQIHSLSLTAGLHALNGDIPQAASLVKVARMQIWPQGQREGYVGALYQVAEGVLALEEGDFERALAHVSVMEPHLDTIEHWPLFMHLQSLAMLGAGQAAEASTLLAATLQRVTWPQVTGFARARLAATQALLLTAGGQLRSAEVALKPHPKRVPVIALEWARLYLTQGAPEAARRALKPLDDEELSPRVHAEFLLLRAASALRMGDTGLALDGLDRAVALLEDRRLRMPLLLLPDGDRDALVTAAAVSGRSYDLLDDFPDPVRFLLPPLTPVSLTKREHVVLHALVNTSSTADLAATLFVSVNTVKSQLRSLYRKLGANSRDEALRRAGERGLIQG